MSMYHEFTNYLERQLVSIEDGAPISIQEAVDAAIAAVVGGAPGVLDTLNELAAALGDDPNFATSITTALAAKSDTEHGHIGTYVALSTVDAAADLLVGTGADTVGRLAKGAALDVLRVNAGATALEWAAPSGGGGITGLGTGTDSTLVGTSAVASSNYSTALGARASAATGPHAIAIGGGLSTTAAPSATSTGSLAIGASAGTAVNGARASGSTSIAIGAGWGTHVGAAATADDAIALGRASSAASLYSVALGSYAVAQSYNSCIAIGGSSTAVRAAYCASPGGIAIGAGNPGASATGFPASIAIGGGNSTPGAAATAANAIAIGQGASATHSNAVALGQGVATTTTDQVNIGARRLHLGVPTTAPADADLVNGQVSFWYDEAGGTLSFKIKSSAGVVKNGTAAVA